MVGLILAAAGSWLIYDGHIYVPLGTVALVLTAAGFGLMATVVSVSHAEPDTKTRVGALAETQTVAHAVSPEASSSTTSS